MHIEGGLKNSDFFYGEYCLFPTTIVTTKPHLNQEAYTTATALYWAYKNFINWFVNSYLLYDLIALEFIYLKKVFTYILLLLF